jgi:hypothetical protein
MAPAPLCRLPCGPVTVDSRAGSERRGPSTRINGRPGARLHAVPLGAKEQQTMATPGQEIEKRSDFGPISVSLSVRGPTHPSTIAVPLRELHARCVSIYCGRIWCIPIYWEALRPGHRASGLGSPTLGRTDFTGLTSGQASLVDGEQGVLSRNLKTVKFGRESVKFQGRFAERTAGSAVQAVPSPDSGRAQPLAAESRLNPNEVAHRSGKGGTGNPACAARQLAAQPLEQALAVSVQSLFRSSLLHHGPPGGSGGGLRPADATAFLRRPLLNPQIG